MSKKKRKGGGGRPKQRRGSATEPLAAQEPKTAARPRQRILASVGASDKRVGPNAPDYGVFDRYLIDKLGFSEARLWQLRILFATYIGYVGYYLTRKVWGIVKTSLRDDLGITLQQSAHIWTAFLTAYMVGQFVNSFIGRRYGARLLMLGGLGISMLCNVIFGFANSYPTFLAFMTFNGLVQASGWPGSVGTVSHWLPTKERGRIMGAWGTNFIFGNILVKSIGGFLLGLTGMALAGWRLAFLGCTLITFAIWWIIYFWQRDKPEDVGLPPFIDSQSDALRTVEGSRADRITLAEHLRIVTHPVVLTMGISYFCVKFLRYALDSWLPTFLNIQGLDKDDASYYSLIFDLAGFFGAILAGWALDRWFKGKWALVSFLMSLGMIVGYLAVIKLGTSPVSIAIWFGLVGFMLYGPDTLLSGAASVQVAGEKNGVAITGVVNGLGSIGPILQEVVIGQFMKGDDPAEGIRNTKILFLTMSVAFAVLMMVVMWRVRLADGRSRPGAS